MDGGGSLSSSSDLADREREDDLLSLQVFGRAMKIIPINIIGGRWIPVYNEDNVEESNEGGRGKEEEYNDDDNDDNEEEKDNVLEDTEYVSIYIHRYCIQYR